MSYQLTKKGYLFVSLLGISLLALSVGSARADIVPATPTITPHGSHFTWSYDVTLTHNATLTSGNFFTLYDFAGFVPSTNFQSANWVFSSALVGKTPQHQKPLDNPAIPNLTWTYTGPNLGRGTLDLGLFGADSKSSSQTMGSFASETANPEGLGNIHKQGEVNVPDGPALVPEPSSLLLLVPGLMPLGLLLRKRQR
jgi:hypothetical protein